MYMYGVYNNKTDNLNMLKERESVNGCVFSIHCTPSEHCPVLAVTLAVIFLCYTCTTISFSTQSYLIKDGIVVNVNYSISVSLGNANGTGPPSEEFTAMASEEASKKEGREGEREREREREGEREKERERGRERGREGEREREIERERERVTFILFFQHLSLQMF